MNADIEMKVHDEIYTAINSLKSDIKEMMFLTENLIDSVCVIAEVMKNYSEYVDTNEFHSFCNNNGNSALLQVKLVLPSGKHLWVCVQNNTELDGVFMELMENVLVVDLTKYETGD